MNNTDTGFPVFDEILGKMRSGVKAGAGIDMSGGTISVITPPEGVPYVAGDGIAINGATVMADLDGGAGIAVNGSTITADVAAVGFGMELAGGTASYARYRNIETVTGSSVTLMAGHAYKIYATAAAVTLNTETIPAGQYGQEGYLKIFVAGTGYVQTGANVVLANALEPDAVNNCAVRFHDGLAIISVEDHVAGYIVVSATGTSSGSLYYGLATSTNEYIAVDASLNGSTLDMGGAVTNGEKHIVGNGYSDTILTGGVSCTSQTTFSNLTMSGVVNSGGTMTLGDVYIPQGGTVSVSGGGLAIENVAGDSGIIDLGMSTPVFSSGGTVRISGCTLSGGSSSKVFGSSFSTTVFGVGKNTSLAFIGCTFDAPNSFNANTDFYFYLPFANGAVSFIDCNYTSGFDYVALMLQSNARCSYSNCQLPRKTQTNYEQTSVVIGGSCYMSGRIIGTNTTSSAGGTVTIREGAILNMSGNTNGSPVAPGGGVTFGANVTIINSAGSSVLLNGGEAGSCTKINNDGTTE